MTTLLLDTNSLFFRAHHALPPMTTRAGEPTSALYGVSALLLKLLRELRPETVAFARDLPQPTFRHRQYAAYKAGRPPVPDALRTQWRRLDELLEALGVPAHAASGFEADDVLATLACRLREHHDVTIVSGDRDLFQTIGTRVQVLFIGARGQTPETVDVAAVAARYGILPSGMPMWSALVGEAADNLLGVPGIGARTASKLVARYGSMRELLAHAADVTPIRIRDALLDARARVLLNEDLATLRTDVPLTGNVLAAPVGASALQAVSRLFEVLEFKSLQSRLQALVPG